MTQPPHKTIYFISPYPFESAPSQRFRYEQYISEFEKRGYSCVFFPFIDASGWNVLYQNGHFFSKMVAMLKGFARRWQLMFRLKKADSIFVHREMAHFGPPVFEWFASKIMRVKFIYDFDDAIWLPNYSAQNAKFHWIKWYWKVPTIIRLADRVTVGNAFLATYAKRFNPNTTIIPTTIDMDHHHNVLIDYRAPEIHIGWTGTHSTMHYLDEIFPVIEQLEKKYAFHFTVISDSAPIRATCTSLRFVKWKKESEITDLAQFSIGLMPLKEDQWSEGKCGFKALQYMSLGIPAVISPVGVNKQIIESGKNGFLFADQAALYTILESLIVNEALREQIGLQGRQTVRERYSTSANLHAYLQLFEPKR